jgi:hypothetical protein
LALGIEIIVCFFLSNISAFGLTTIVWASSLLHAAHEGASDAKEKRHVFIYMFLHI